MLRCWQTYKCLMFKPDVLMFQNGKILHGGQNPEENTHEGVWLIHWDHRTWTGKITHIYSVPSLTYNRHCSTAFLFLGKKIWHHPNTDSHRVRSGDLWSGKFHRQSSWPDAILKIHHTLHLHRLMFINQTSDTFQLFLKCMLIVLFSWMNIPNMH